MSTLLLNTLTGKTSAGSIDVTSEGTTKTINLQQGLCKSWVNQQNDASQSNTNDSFNVSSAADIRDHLAKVKSVHGVSGRWDYTSDGDAWAPVSIGQVQDGKFVKIVSQIEPY